MPATERLPEQTVVDVLDECGRDIATATMHPWATARDVRMSQRLIADLMVLTRIVNERVPFFLVRQAAFFFLFAGVALGATASSLVWLVVT